MTFREIVNRRLEEMSESLRDMIGREGPVSRAETIAYLIDFYNTVTKDKGKDITNYQGENLKTSSKSYFEDLEESGLTKRGRKRKWK